MSIILRSFIQRDDSQIAEYLEGLEGGAVDGAIVQKDLEEGAAGGQAGVNIPPISAGGKGERRQSSETTASMRRTPVSNFQRLYELLDEAGDIHRLEECDHTRFASVQDRHVLELELTCELSLQDRKVIELRRAASQAGEIVRMAGELKGALEPLLDAASSLGVELPTDDTDSGLTLDQIRQLRAPSIPPVGQPQRLVVLGRVVGLSTARCVIPVPSATLQRDPEELEGELTVLGKVRRTLRKGEKLDPAELGALPTGLNRKQRRRAASTSRQIVRYPALVLDPIAIYR